MTGKLIVDPLGIANRILNQISMAYAPGGFYIMIALKFAGGGGHVMSAYFGCGRNPRWRDVAIFDPNFGDYWFQTKDEFCDFFRWLVRNRYRTACAFDLRTFGRSSKVRWRN